eukprot:CAMPEP_0183503812 /NCGR_PEP_ID=MMETSP0371-20130417/5383_1 /TAXON_ID=268820 /ORGANISM="Peridinium aciculiferum, Strain PAER-2" /LENGTH=87 /DNA_ID=CAMNT_0025699009 /DNA_START=411 /DNA_END=674 /DNA_ORIENTATION=+
MAPSSEEPPAAAPAARRSLPEIRQMPKARRKASACVRLPTQGGPSSAMCTGGRPKRWCRRLSSLSNSAVGTVSKASGGNGLPAIAGR